MQSVLETGFQDAGKRGGSVASAQVAANHVQESDAFAQGTADTAKESETTARPRSGVRDLRRVRRSAEYNDMRTGGFKLKTTVYVGGVRYKSLKGIDKNYFISTDGHLIGYAYGKDGFTEVPLSKNGTGASLYIHGNVNWNGNIHGNGIDGVRRKAVVKYYRLDYLVATAWRDNPRRYAYVRHKDGNMFNCNAENLVWVAERQVDKVADRPIGIEYVVCGMRMACFGNVAGAVNALGLSAYEVLRHVNTLERLPDGGALLWMWKQGSEQEARQQRRMKRIERNARD